MTLVAISTRADGSTYNRHDHTDAQVIANREDFLARHGLSLDDAVRVHVHYESEDFCRYIGIDDSCAGKGTRDNDIEAADALITTSPNLTLILPVADCIGAAIIDEGKGVLALAHLGRHSLEQQGGTKIIEHLIAHYSVRPTDLKIWLTPAAGKEKYPLWALENKSMKEAAFEQFEAAGVSSGQIIDNTADTTSDPNYYSYSEFVNGRDTEDADHLIIATLK